MKTRIISALVALPLLIIFVVLGGLPLKIGVTLVALIGLFEFYKAFSGFIKPVHFIGFIAAIIYMIFIEKIIYLIDNQNELKKLSVNAQSSYYNFSPDSFKENYTEFIEKY